MEYFKHCAIIIWTGWGWETKKGGHGGKSQVARGGLGVKFNTYRRGGTLLFSPFLTNWKSDRRAIRVQVFTLGYTES